MKRALITGGAGFIGSNLAVYLLNHGWRVTLFDNLSRKGTKSNLSWIRSNCDVSHLTLCTEDIRNYEAVRKEAARADAIFHLAGQVAVTTSFLRPKEDFDINLVGTMNILESARESGHKPIIIFASTNKVYGELEGIAVLENKKRYEFSSDFKNGISETNQLDFHSPYGCSKGAADQYIRDYYRMYGIPTVVFRQSCIYGPRQMGMEDQGWVAHFAIKTSLDEPLSIYGNGKQVRDLLHVYDLIAAYQSAIDQIDQSKGKIYNIGGGRDHTFSLLEYITFMEKLSGKKINLNFQKTRPGDQKIYISDNAKITRELSWKPAICHKDGLKELYNWVKNNLDLFKQKKIMADIFVASPSIQPFVLAGKPA